MSIKTFDFKKGYSLGSNGDVLHGQEPTYVQNRHNSIKDICEVLSCDTTKFLPELVVETAYDKIKEYKDTYFRWAYSDISNYLFAADEETAGKIISNIDSLRNYAYMRTSQVDPNIVSKRENIELAQFIDKLWDHSNLAKNQKTAFSQKTDDIQNIVDDKITPRVNELENGLRKELISLIAIFTALSFVVFGGISALDNIFEGATSFPILQVLIIGCIWGLCILNLVFVFVFFVSKLTKLSICSTDDMDATLSQKYPFWIWSNFGILLILAIVLLVYFIDYSDSGYWLISWANHRPGLTLLLGLILIALIFGTSAYFIVKKKSCKK